MAGAEDLAAEGVQAGECIQSCAIITQMKIIFRYNTVVHEKTSTNTRYG